MRRATDGVEKLPLTTRGVSAWQRIAGAVGSGARVARRLAVALHLGIGHRDAGYRVPGMVEDRNRHRRQAGRHGAVFHGIPSGPRLDELATESGKRAGAVPLAADQEIGARIEGPHLGGLAMLAPALVAKEGDALTEIGGARFDDDAPAGEALPKRGGFFERAHGKSIGHRQAVVAEQSVQLVAVVVTIVALLQQHHRLRLLQHQPLRPERRPERMLIPRRLKHRKQHHPGRSGAAKGGTTIAFGDYGIQALEPAYVTNRQIESARIAMTRYMKRGGKVWINIYPDRPLTKKPAETRMGSGKGSPEYWVAVVKPGRVLFEVGGIEESVAREALRLASTKLPLRTKIYSKAQMEHMSGGDN